MGLGSSAGKESTIHRHTNMKPVITKISLINEDPKSPYLNNPIFSCIEVGPDDEAAGSFLRIKLTNETGERLQPGEITLDWNEWDSLIKIVEQHRTQWDWE
jgi:hypothetical protein